MSSPSHTGNALSTSLVRELIAFSFAGYAFYACQHFNLGTLIATVAAVLAFVVAEGITQSTFDDTVPHIETSGTDARSYARFTAIAFLGVFAASAMAISLLNSILLAFSPLIFLFAYPYIAIAYADRRSGNGHGSKAPRGSPFYQQGTRVSFSASNLKPRVSLFGAFSRRFWMRGQRAKTPHNSSWEALIKKGYIDEDD